MIQKLTNRKPLEGGSKWGKYWLRILRSIVVCSDKSEECSGKIEFCHFKSTKLSGHNGRGLNKRVADILRNPQCYIAKCEFHHYKSHGKNRRTVARKLSKLKDEDLIY